MHQLLSAGLWPTPVSVLARFVHPFSLVLLPPPPPSPCRQGCLSIHLLLRREDYWDCVYTLLSSSSCLSVSFFLPNSLVCLSMLPPFSFFTLPPPLTSPFLSSSQHVSTCLSSSLLHQKYFSIGPLDCFVLSVNSLINPAQEQWWPFTCCNDVVFPKPETQNSKTESNGLLWLLTVIVIIDH